MTIDTSSSSSTPRHILVVDPDPGFAQQIREALDHPDWRTHLVEDRAAAYARAEQQQPDLVLVDVGLPGASDLLARFARRDGAPGSGPGAMALVPAAIFRRVQAADYRADELLAKPFSIDDLRSSVEGWLARSAVMPAPPQAPLSSEDLFGEILAEVEAETRQPKKSAIDDDLERKLERTLSGLMEVDRPRTPATRSTSTSPRSDIDRLLDQRLGDLATSRKRRPAPRPAAPRTREPHTPETPSPPTAVPPPVTKPPRQPTPSAPPVSVLDGNLDHFATRKIPTMPHLAAAADPAKANEDDGQGERFGEYALLERIAVGGMAEVWRARRTGVEGFQKTLAIKKILSHLAGTPDVVSMLVDEAKLAAQLSHDNIIQIYDLGKVDNDFFIAMELVDGMDLRSILAAARAHELPLPIGHALWIAARLAHALDHAHRKQGFDGRDLGIVHRDVSPQNVLIGTEGEIKLCDFGIARAVSRVGNTQMGALKGKLQYMSPEQAWGREVDSRTDIFSLGSVLFEMLTGAKLFGGDSEISILDSVRDCQIPTPSALRAEIPKEAEAILLRALAKAPEERYQRAGDMAADLDDLLRGLEPQPSSTALAAFVARLDATTPSATERLVKTTTPAPQPAATAEPQPVTPSVAEPAPSPASAATTEGSPAHRATSPQEPAGPKTAAVAEPDAPATEPETPIGPQVETVPAATEAAYDLLAEEGAKPRRRWLPLVAAALVVAILVASWIAFQRRGKTDAGATPAAGGPPASVAPAAVPTPEPTLMAPGEAAVDTGSSTVPATTVTADTPDQADDPSTTPPAEMSAASPPEEAADTATTDTDTSAEPADNARPALDPDIERMVADEIERRAEKLRRDFERERQKLQRELDKAKEAVESGPTPAPPPPPPAGGTEAR